MAKSIICNEKRCVKCGTYNDIHKHHIFGGSRRNTSEKYGMWMYLCPTCRLEVGFLRQHCSECGQRIMW